MTYTLATLTALILPALALIAAAVLVGRRIADIQRRATLPLDWNGELSVERYRPMFRLLADADLDFLRAQPGVTPAMVSRLRKQRAQVFRGYLSALQHDFNQASRALMVVLIQSQSDRPDLIPVLIGSQVRFATGLLRVRCRLMLYRWDIAQEPIARLVDLFEEMQAELRSLAPLPQASGA